MDDLRPLTYAIISVLFPITLITIPMRIWVRAVSMKSFGWDDWTMASMIVRRETLAFDCRVDANETSSPFRSSFLASKRFCIIFL